MTWQRVQTGTTARSTNKMLTPKKSNVQQKTAPWGKGKPASYNRLCAASLEEQPPTKDGSNHSDSDCASSSSPDHDNAAEDDELNFRKPLSQDNAHQCKKRTKGRTTLLQCNTILFTFK